MRSFSLVSILTVIVAVLNGCAYLPARYDSVQSVRDGIPDHGTLSQDDVLNWDATQLIIEDRDISLDARRMAVDKLRNATPEIGIAPDGTPQGYLGIVKNFSERETYNFIIRGPEKVAFLLGPGQQKEYSLVPGEYTCFVYRDNRPIGKPWIFHVNLQKHYFMDRWIHWYVIMRR